ncbi:hypothetical protein [Thalassomonas haliotis]|uniref:Uncharacterized protein n=1 Tax=Thalassomonas haliotis TaxID=485448 RepID=A0ABY7VFQ8_9GAMM|nr:hypothetical protein [Thalassomonas haliotis]WDE11846.1 hypothetical protein H3N35_27275 [Thalassomonas haliotis]
MTSPSVQEKAIEICFPDNNAFALPCDPNNPDEVDCFQKDNPHIKSTVIPPGTPYILRREIGENPRPWQELRPDLSDTFTRLNNLDAETRRNIANMNKTFGSELLVALSEFHRVEIAPLVLRTKEYAKDKVWKTVNKESGGLIGAGVGALDNRLTNFNKAVLESQRALEEVRNGYQAKMPKLKLYKLEQTARELLREMKYNFQAELTKYMRLSLKFLLEYEDMHAIFSMILYYPPTVIVVSNKNIPTHQTDYSHIFCGSNHFNEHL